MDLIGFCGLAGSGKDTAADFLVERGAVKVAFADPVKRVARDLYDFTDQQLWGPSQYRNEPDMRYPREHGPAWVDDRCACCETRYSDRNDFQCYLTPRHVCQQLGTEFGRACYPNTWVDLCIRTAKKLLTSDEPLAYDQKRGLYSVGEDNYVKTPCVIVSDVRFLNEIQGIQKAGGKIVRVVRQKAGLEGARGRHASETEQLEIPDSVFDHIIYNDGSLDGLRDQVDHVVREYWETAR